MLKRIIKIVPWLILSILLLIVVQIAVTQSILYVFRKDSKKISKQLDTALYASFQKNININNSPSGPSLTNNMWSKYVIFGSDSSKIHLMLSKHYLKKQINVWNALQRLSMEPRTCRNSDNLIKDSVLCNDIPIIGTKMLVFSRKNYLVKIYWENTSKLSLQRVIGVAQAVEKTILEN